MADISEHDTEEEGEDGYCEKSGIYLFVSWNTVSVNNFLEGGSEIVGFEVGGRADFGGGLSHCDNVGETELEESGFVLRNPNFSNHGASRFFLILNNFKQIKRVVDDGLFLNECPIGFILGTLILPNWHNLLQILFQLFFGHGAQLFGVIDGVFNLFNLLEDGIFAGLDCIPLSSEGLAYPCNFVEDGGSWLKDDDEGSSWLDLELGVGFLDFVFGDAEGVEDAVAFGGSEDGPSEFQHIFVWNNSWDVDQSELFESGLGEINLLGGVVGVVSWAEDLPGFKEKIFVVLQIHYFPLGIFEGPHGILDALVCFVDLVLDVVDHGLFGFLPLFENWVNG